jgi:general secretion pathway protein A
MFETYFSLRENPFKLDLDTSYIFWGQHHEEVIAHLKYAVMEGEGFIAITGERGVGKTIICTSFIENLHKNVITAYIDTPVGGAEKLLKIINVKFNIRHKAQGIKELTDVLNNFLMQKKVEGKKVAVFIDDAHMMKKDTLEQVRLISNLETSRDKLIQIVMVGEPKLTEMLASYDLRQIGQRVSVSYNINPLNFTETSSYIQHRVSIASKGPPVLFDQKALSHIFKYSGGVPRAINIACNRALLEAFKRKERRITSDIAKEVVGYLKNRGEKATIDQSRPRKIGRVIVGCSIFLTIAGVVYFLQLGSFEKSVKQLNSEKPEINKMPKPKSHKNPVKMFAEDTKSEEIELKKHTNAQIEPTGSMDPTAESDKSTISVEPFSSTELTHSIQVGAFLNLDNAQKLVDQLKAKGYLPDIFSAKDSQGRLWHTVRIGDYRSKKEARDRADKFSELEKIETAVRPFGQL